MLPEPPPEDARRWLESLPERARRCMPPPVWTYVQAGARDGVTAAEATAAWHEVRFRPRVLRGVDEAGLETLILGDRYSSPLAVAPTSMQRAVHPQGERAMVAGADAAGCLHVVASNAGTRFGDLQSARWWLQVYLPADRDDVLPVLEAATAAGATAAVLTVDTPHSGTKYAVHDADWTGIDLSWWRSNFDRPDSDRSSAVHLDDVAWLRERSGLPVVVKGLLRGDDAIRSLEAGADAVYVSNHGGRQLDRSVSTARALAEVVAAVGDRCEVYVDGGVRSGLDALAALALGAQAVFVGRPALHALAVDGARGVERLLAELSGELADALVLAGCARPTEAPDLLAPSALPGADLG
jgi:4-hydroxymandelate oxidase